MGAYSIVSGEPVHQSVQATLIHKQEHVRIQKVFSEGFQHWLFLGERGTKYHYKRGHDRLDDGQHRILYFVIFQGTRTGIAKKPYIFVIFQGSGVWTPCPPLWIRSLRGPWIANLSPGSWELILTKQNLFLALLTALAAILNLLGNFGIGHCGEHLCEIVLNLDLLFKNIFISSGLEANLLGRVESFEQFW